jgi:hypothetical protein
MPVSLSQDRVGSLGWRDAAPDSYFHGVQIIKF